MKKKKGGPKLMGQKKRVKMSVSIDAKTKRLLESEAKRLKRSRSYLIDVWAEQFLTEKKKGK